MQFTLTVIEGLPLLEAGSFLNYTVYFLWFKFSYETHHREGRKSFCWCPCVEITAGFPCKSSSPSAASLRHFPLGITKVNISIIGIPKAL